MPPFAGGWPASRPTAPRAPVVFVTWRLEPGQRVLAAAEREVVCQVLRRGHVVRYRLVAFVVMDDHVHVLVRINPVQAGRLFDSWRLSSADQLRRIHRRAGGVWQKEASSTVITAEEDLRQAVEYVVGNPWKRWPFVKGYPWVWDEATAG
jgi:REP element-mobilizing transposase RayT